MQETELIQLLKNPHSQEKGFNMLISMYKERIYWHIRRMVDLHEDADDLVQQTFIKVFRNINKFKGDSKIYTWMYRIATNECLTHLEKRSKKMTQEFQGQHIGSYETESSAQDIMKQLNHAVQLLPAKQKAVFNMKYFDDMSYQEISDVLGTSIGALKASYHHASAKIKNELQKTMLF